MTDKYSADLLYGIFSPSELYDGEGTRNHMAFGSPDPIPRPGSFSPSVSDEVSGEFRERIALHRLFPDLLQAYVDCRKVGAPPEIANELEEIEQVNNKLLSSSTKSFVRVDNSDPELDDFMETYCEMLKRYKSDLSGPFDEAMSFLSEMQAQLNDLGNLGASISYVSDEGGGNSSEDEVMSGSEDASHGVMAGERRELKEKLLRKYSGYIGSLKHEFSKKKKKGKLPREARQALLDWWALHYRWPYPTEGDKIALGGMTGLDQKQINNWFINQRKRHWKPPHSISLAFMDPHSPPPVFYHQ